MIFEMGRELTTPLLDGEGAHAPMGVKVFFSSLAALMRLQMDPFDRTPLQYRTQVRFWIPLKISAEYDYMMPRLPENAKIKIPQVGTYFTL